MNDTFMEVKKNYNSFELKAGLSRLSSLRYDPANASGKSYLDTIYSEENIPFSSTARKGFIPGVPVHVTITQAEHCVAAASRLSPYLYTIKLSHGPFTWTVKKRYHHFFKLNTSIVVARNKPNFGQNKKVKEDVTDKPEENAKNDVTPRERRKTETLSRIDEIEVQNADKGHDETDRQEVRMSDNEWSEREVSESEDEISKVKFPKKPDVLLPRESQSLDERRKQLEGYLQQLVKSEELRNHKDLLEFLEVSEYSFLRGCEKRKEGIVKKRTGDDHSHGWIKRLLRNLRFLICNACGIRWRKSWILIQETCLIGVSPKTGEIRTVLLFDQDFACSQGVRQTGVKNSILISNYSRSLWIKTFTARKTKDWADAIEKVVTGSPARSFIQENRYGSFAPVRSDQLGQWFVDGERYMASVATAIEQAKEEIFITDWWLSPEIHLKRGVNFSDEFRLDKLLKKKSAEGVRIFILLYKEFQLALSLNSFYTKRTLMTRGGRNIKVLRHPDRVGADVNDFLWAHHEKLVVVDQVIAFVGGIDLCYGRWDTNQHPLTDVDAVDMSTTNSKPFMQLPPSNSSRSKPRLAEQGMHLAYVLKTAHEVSTAPIRAMDIADNKIEGRDQADAVELSPGETRGRMKTRIRKAIISARIKLNRKNSSVKEEDSSAESEFSEYESALSDSFDTNSCDDNRPISARKSVRVKRSIQKAIKKIKKSNTRRKGSDVTSCQSPPSIMKNNFGYKTDESDDEPFSLEEDATDSCLPTSNLWKGKDYVNFIVKDIARPDLPEADNVDRRTTPRMPWHDIAVMVSGSAARDAARHFIQRWNAIKSKKAKFNPKYPFLVPKTYSRVDEDKEGHTKSYFAATSKTQSHKINCQVLRSCSSWSAGIDTVESSIHSAYVQVIEESKHYIYIENQFFITSANPGLGESEVKNGIGTAIFNRIVRAHNEKSPFKVFIMLPLLPAFEGQIGSATTGNAIRVILHYNYASICRGNNSLFGQLKKCGINPMNYVSFCSLRTWGDLLGTPVTELVYIHSKLLICDDRIVICGSANINDRSMLGTRDSEVCLIMEDTEFSAGLMNGEKAESGRFAGSLRRKLMREHLGLDSDRASHELIQDCVSDTFWKDTWLRRASINTKLFEDTFFCNPTDQVTTLEECRLHEEKTPLAEVDRFGTVQILKKVKGNLVLLPFRFLENEDLLPSYFAKEGIVPTVTWT